MSIRETWERCSRADARRKCRSRREAMQAGEMFYSAAHRGWIWPANSRTIPNLLRERGQQPFPLRFCPFCGEALPDEVSAVTDVLRERAIPPWPDPGEGEES